MKSTYLVKQILANLLQQKLICNGKLPAVKNRRNALVRAGAAAEILTAAA